MMREMCLPMRVAFTANLEKEGDFAPASFLGQTRESKNVYNCQGVRGVPEKPLFSLFARRRRRREKKRKLRRHP